MVKDREEQYDLIKEIHVKYDQKIVEFLRESNYRYKICEYKDFSPYQTKEDIEEEILSIEITKDLYEDLDKLCKINNWDTNEKIISILGSAVFSADIESKNGFKHVENF